jgi:uncharacterized protein (DUF2252 family)
VRTGAAPGRSRPAAGPARAAGRAARKRLPRSANARGADPAARQDPIEILRAAEPVRLPDLLPIRYGRMAASPFAFLRGSAAVMAADLAAHPDSGIRVQACGDAHLLNLGLFATPERRLVFDINDFDETLPAPFEWDVKRLAASIVVAGRHREFGAAVIDEALSAMLASYRGCVTGYASMRVIDVWYARIDADNAEELTRTVNLKAAGRRATEKGLAQARRRGSLRAFAKLTEVVDGHRRIREDPPLLFRVDADEQVLRAVWQGYRQTIPTQVKSLLDRYELVDFAGKVVGVGSVGTRCWIILLESARADDPLILQVKQANASVLEPYAGHSRQHNHGRRVVEGQRLLQAAGDPFLGWTRDPAEGVDYYVRQLWDGKGSVDIDRMRPNGFTAYADLCGQALARAHARTGDPAEISGYLGSGDGFDRAIGEFAQCYADQTQRDHGKLLDAIAAGRVKADLSG